MLFAVQIDTGRTSDRQVIQWPYKVTFSFYFGPQHMDGHTANHKIQNCLPLDIKSFTKDDKIQILQ